MKKKKINNIKSIAESIFLWTGITFIKGNRIRNNKNYDEKSKKDSFYRF
jgi:hypothetical protein